jgi:hypothetical protein
MMSQLPAVSLHQVDEHHWLATHEPSGRQTSGTSAAEAEEAMRVLLGFNEQGHLQEAATSDLFEGIASLASKAIRMESLPYAWAEAARAVLHRVSR